MWMASSAGVAIATSPNGISWTAIGTARASNDLASFNSLWLMPTAIGAYGGIPWSADRGATWQKTAVGNHRTATDGWKRIITAGDRFIVAHADGTNLEFALSMRSS